MTEHDRVPKQKHAVSHGFRFVFMHLRRHANVH
jgi:hypothetical protein